MSIYKRIMNKLAAPPKTINTQDEFINWLFFANAGMLHRGNLYCFDYAIKNIPADTSVVEIGSFCGLSTNAITYYLAKNSKNNKIITCDNWVFENAGKFLENGGFILLDDSVDNSVFECARLPKKIIKGRKYEVVVKNPNYLFKKNSVIHNL